MLVGLAGVLVAGFYDVEQVNEIRLYFSEPNWDEILDSLYAAGQGGRLIGTAVINGVRFDSVGVRYKGASSYNPSRRKNPFNIRLDERIPGQNIEGHGTLRLANVYKDPSFVREVLSYEIARRYMPAGRASFANIYVNDTLIGLYTNNEDPDKLFLRRFFYCDENARFKGRMTDSARMIGWKYLGPDSGPYRHYFELESDSGWRELIAFLDTLNNANSAVDRVLNIDRHLWMLAFDVLMVNLDAPINMPQNYYLYRDAAGRFNPIVWDLNENFGAFRDLAGTGQLSVAQMQQLDPFLRANDPDYPIVSRVLNDSRRRRAYVAHMKTMIGDLFSNNRYRDRAYEIQEIIDAHVRADPNKFYTYNDFINNVTRSVGQGPLAIVGLTELMGQRISYLLNRPEFRATAPLVTETRIVPARPAPGSLITFLAQVEGADSVFLGLRHNPAMRFCMLPMFDDGQHGDGQAGDGLYGVSVRMGAGEFNWFVYAENTDAAAFLPERAEYEFFTVPIAGTVTINELMARNVRTVRDPSGEYDDWIELCNNSSSPISLDGFLLTDDTLNIVKWEFPDVTIPPHGYLIVWADGDTWQPGLHANFRLNDDGDALVLSDPDGRPVDRVVFGPQNADISFGRYPDGVGTFRMMNPSWRSANDSGVALVEPESRPSFCRLEGACPNPFVGSTVVSYSLSVPGWVSLRAYDGSGRLIGSLVEADRPAGRHYVQFSVAENRAAAGVYFVHITVRNSNESRSECIKLVLVKE